MRGNWAWIVDVLRDHDIEGDFDCCPSQSTISRFLSKSDEFAIKQTYLETLRQSQKENDFSEVVPRNITEPKFKPQYCIDGKRREGCTSDLTGRTEIDLTIMRADTREVLASCVCPDKEGEATSGTKLLKQSGLKLLPGIFTFDAGITGPKFIKEVIATGHWYIAAIKGNAGNVFSIAVGGKWDESKLIAETSEESHGRREKRSVRILMISAFPPKTFSKYARCACVIQVTREYEEKGKFTSETRYFIGSRGVSKLTPIEILGHVRAHWIQENGLHWCKDAILGEDDLFRSTKKTSRILGFFKTIVVAVAHQMMGSVSKLVDTYAASPQVMTLRLMCSG